MIGFGNSVIGLGIAIKLHDMFSATSRTVGRSMDELSTKADTLTNSQKYRQIGTLLTSFGRSSMGFLYDGIKLAASYEKEMSKVSVELENFTQQDRRRLDSVTTKLSEGYGLSRILLGKAVVNIARQGVEKSSDIERILKASTMLAVSTDLPVMKVADHLGDMMMMFGRSARAAMDFADKVAYTANKSNVEVHDIFKSVSYLGPAFRTAGATAEEALAIIGSLANAGIKGSRAGTSISQFIVQLANAMGEFRTNKQAHVLKKWGLEMEDVIDPVTGKTKNLVEVMQLLGKKALTGTLSGAAYVNAMFNSRGGRAIASALANPIGRDIKQLYEGINKDANGFASKISNVVANSPELRMARMAEAWKNFKMDVGEALIPLMPMVTSLVTKFVHLAKAIASSGLGKILVLALGAISAISLVLGPVFLMISAMGQASFIWVNILKVAFSLTGGLLSLSAKLVSLVSGGRILAGVNAFSGFAWYKDMMNGGKFTSFKTLFGSLTDWMSTAIGRVGMKVTWLTDLFPVLGNAAKTIGSAMASTWEVMTGPIGWILLALTALTGVTNTWHMLVEAIVAPFLAIYALAKSITDLFMGTLTNPFDTYDQGMRDFRGFAWGDRNSFENNLPDYSKQLFGVRDKETKDSSNNKDSYSNNYNYAGPGYSTPAGTNLNIYIDGRRKINKEIERAMDENIKADE